MIVRHNLALTHGAESPRVCSVAGCSRPEEYRTHHLCGMHYQRLRKHGDVNYVRPSRSVPKTHGHTVGRKRSPEMMSWMAMRQRCLNPRATKFPSYGGRGIRVCSRWRESLPAFVEDMGTRPSGHTLDRKDPQGHYSCGHCQECVANGWPANCRWATAKEQTRNRRPFENSSSRKTHCPAGHPYSGENVRVSSTGRKCRACDRERAAKARSRRKRQ